VAINRTQGAERVTLRMSVNSDALPENPRKALDSGGIASKGRRREMDVITDMHSLQARARGIGGSGLDDGLSRGTDGRRRGDSGGLVDLDSKPMSPRV